MKHLLDNKRKKILLFLGIISIFATYFILAPMGDGYQDINKDYYKFNTVSTSQEALFKKVTDSYFFIQISTKNSATGRIVFLQPANIRFNFSIAPASSTGNIDFRIKKNGKIIQKVLVTAKSQLFLDVRTGDEIEIIATGHGNSFFHRADLRIKIKDRWHFLYSCIPVFLWFILFIFLFTKGYAVIFINSYFIFLLSLLAEKINWGAQDLRTAIIYTSLAMGFTFLFILFQQKSSQSLRFKVLSACLHIVFFAAYVVPALFIAYTINYGASIDRHTVVALLQSNYKEVWEHALSFIPLQWGLIASLISAIFIALLWKQKKMKGVEIKASYLIVLILITFTIGLAQLKHPKIPELIIMSSYRYTRQLILFRKFQSSRTKGVDITASKTEEDEIYIVVIGESLNKQHMGLYGYARETTPNLSKMENLIVFQNAYSSHTHTGATLSLALTEANQLNEKKYHQSPSIINIINKSHAETHWISNQNLMGPWDNMAAAIGLEAKNVVSINSTIGKRVRADKYDGGMIKEVENVLMEKTKKSRIIFVHLMGSHSHYCARYPKNEFPLFTGSLKPGNFGSTISSDSKKFNWENINCYDNSVLYNDYVVSSLLKIVQKKGGVTGFLYISDHSEDIFNNLGHNSGSFTYEMTEIPMLAWFSPKYKKRYPNKFQALLNNTQSLYSNGFLYDTLIGIFNIKTKRYHSKYDLSSSNYELKPSEAYVLRRKKKYTDSDNAIYWTRKNTMDLVQSKQSNRVFLSKVNSLGKLKEAWNNGFRSFGLNLWLAKDGNLHLGENANSLGLKLENYLSKISHKKIQRLVLELKNLNEHNYKKILKQLDGIDKKFKIKNKSILVFSLTMPILKKIQKKGWSVSRHLLPMEKKLSKSEAQKWGAKISQKMKTANLRALSFNRELYPLVKRYVKIKNINYHVNYTLHLEEDSFMELLTKDKVFMDKRVKTIFIPNKSKFDL